MGAWTFVESRLRDLLGPTSILRYVGRPAMASPAEGWSDAHAAEQRRIVEAVLEACPGERCEPCRLRFACRRLASR